MSQGNLVGGQQGDGASDTIVSTLASVRRRIFGVRVMERVAVGIAWGAAVGVCLIGARLLEARMSWLAVVVAMLPAMAAGWLWWKRRGVHGSGVQAGRSVAIAAILTGVLALAMAAEALGGKGAPFPAWMIPTLSVLVFAGAAGVTTPRVNLKAAAIFVDRQAGFEEKVATALEMLNRPADTGLEAAFMAPVIAAAAAACGQVRSSQVRYQRLDRRVYALAATVAIAAGVLTLFPPLPAVAHVQGKITVSHSGDQARQLQDVLKQLEEKKLPDDEAKAQALKPIESAIQKLQQGNMSPIETSAVLDEAKDALKKQQDELAATDKVEKMLEAMQQTQDLAKAGEQLAEAKAGEKGDGSAGASAQQALKDAVKQMADKVSSGGMSAEDKKNLADGLRNAAAQAGSDPKLQQELNSAASAAEKGDSQGMSQNLQAAGERMGDQGANRQASQDAVKQAMDQIDRMQGSGGQGSASSMADQTSGGQQGNQGGNQGQNGQGNSGGNQSAGNQDGQQGGGQGSQGSQDQQAAGGQGGGQQQGNDLSSGSTNMEQRGGPGDHSAGRPLGGKTTFVRIYDEKKTETSGSSEKVGSRINPLAGPANGSKDVMGQADDPNSTIKTYEDELPAARQRAMDELSRQEIPPQYRDMVKAFYEK